MCALISTLDTWARFVISYIILHHFMWNLFHLISTLCFISPNSLEQVSTRSIGEDKVHPKPVSVGIPCSVILKRNQCNQNYLVLKWFSRPLFLPMMAVMMCFVITFPSNRSNDLVTRIKVLLVSHSLGQGTGKLEQATVRKSCDLKLEKNIDLLKTYFWKVTINLDWNVISIERKVTFK